MTFRSPEELEVKRASELSLSSKNAPLNQKKISNSRNQLGWATVERTLLSIPSTVWIGLFVSIELVFLRQLSPGRYLALSEAENGTSLLWAHTATKAMALLFFAGFLSAVLSRGLSSPSIKSKRTRGALLAANVISFLSLVYFLTQLPAGELPSPLLKDTQIWAYVAAIASLSVVALTGTALTWSRIYLPGRALTMGIACILAAGAYKGHLDSLIVGSREVIEGTALELSLWFYGLSGRPIPNVEYGGVYPIMSVPHFTIAIAPSCSGYQGMLSAFILLGAYIALERKELRLARAFFSVLAIGGTFVLNALRIAILFYIGEEVSVDVAINGFHSQFGTLSLLVMSAATILAMEHSSFRRGSINDRSIALNLPQDELGRIAHLMFPLAVYLFTAMIFGLFVGTFNWFYPIPVLVTAALLWHIRGGIFQSLNRAPSVMAIVAGVATYVLWIALIPPDPERAAELTSALTSAPAWLAATWIIFRIVGSSILVPLVEELAFRGGLMRFLELVVPASLGRLAKPSSAWLGSSIAFGLLHSDILAGTVAGGMFGAVYLWRRSLIDAVVAHAVTNFLICLHVLGIGEWSYW